MRYLVAFLGKLTLLLSLSAGAEVLAPTTYSTNLVNAAELQCPQNKIRSVFNRQGGKIMELCSKDYKDCMFEGACVVQTVEGNIGLSYDYYDKEKDQSFFIRFDSSQCPYGFGYATTATVKALGTNMLCLDPYFSVAADLTTYTTGDVLFVEALKGVKLPSGETHDGFVIVRDSSKYMEGLGSERIVFFTGFQKSDDKNNALAVRGFSDITKKFEFRKATEEEAKATREKRNFPGLPEHLLGNGSN